MQEWQWVLEGFGQLCRTRPSHGFGPCPLSIADIQSYLDLTGVRDRSSRLAFLELVLILDGIFMEWSQSNGQHSPGNTHAQG